MLMDICELLCCMIFNMECELLCCMIFNMECELLCCMIFNMECKNSYAMIPFLMLQVALEKTTSTLQAVIKRTLQFAQGKH